MPASTHRGRRFASLVLTRAPRPDLQPFVCKLWALDATNTRPPAPLGREHVLPTGQMHLVFRWPGDRLRLFDSADDVIGHLVADAVVGGARAGHYVRDISRPSCAVGAQLGPGAAEALFGVPADELTARHTPLVDLWGRDVNWMHEHVMEPTMLHQRIDRLEAILVARLSTPRPLHPAMPYALRQLRKTSRIERIVDGTGYSHRTLISLFRRCVGLTPKQYCRVLRFQHLLERMSSRRLAPLADLAADAGFADQAHFIRDFKSFTASRRPSICEPRPNTRITCW